MKKLIAIAALCVTALSAFADPLNSLTTTSSGTGTATNQGNAQNITFTAPAETTQTIKNTPSVNGPNLTTSNDTCMGSTSGSLNIAGLGVGGGGTWVDPNCKMLKNSREMWNMGMKAASLALMCTDAANREALEITGYVCPQTIKARKDEIAANGQQYTDPIIRSRLGLAPLAK